MAKKETQELNLGEVEVLLVNPKKTGMLRIRSIRHPETGEIMPLKDQTGADSVYALSKPRTRLNLNDPYFKQVHDILQVHPIYNSKVRPLIRIVNAQADAEERLTRIEKEDQARLIIRQLNSIQLADFARVMGMATDRVSETVLKTRLYDIASDAKHGYDFEGDKVIGAEKVIGEWNHPSRDLKELMHRARQRGVMKTNNGIWYYGQMPMGEGFHKAFLWMQENQDLIPNIRREADKVK